MTKETIVDPISNSELPIKDVLEQLAKSINNAGIPKELFVTIPGEEGLPTQYGGKYILAKQKWLNRECWINAGTASPIHRIFYNPDLSNWCIGNNTTPEKNYVYVGLTSGARWPQDNISFGVSSGKTLIPRNVSIKAEAFAKDLTNRTVDLEEGLKALKQENQSILEEAKKLFKEELREVKEAMKEAFKEEMKSVIDNYEHTISDLNANHEAKIVELKDNYEQKIAELKEELKTQNQLQRQELNTVKIQANKQNADVITELEALKFKNDEQDTKLDQVALLEEGSVSSQSMIQMNPYAVAHSVEVVKDVRINCSNRNNFVATLESSFSNSKPVEIICSILKKMGLGNDLDQDPIERFGIKVAKFFKNRTDLIRFRIKPTAEREFVHFLIQNRSKELGFKIKRHLLKRTRLQKMVS